MLVKFCGITNEDDARFALSSGADWIGLNLIAGPRQIDLDTAASIARALEDPSAMVALIRWNRDGVEHRVLNLLRTLDIRRVQLYGNVNAESIARLADAGLSCILVQQVVDQGSFDRVDALLTSLRSPKPDYVLLDAGSAVELGGTGQVADWSSIAKAREAGRFDAWPPILLAGGLNDRNVTSAIALVKPAGVDVSSGVESAPGSKDHGKVAAFLAAVRRRGKSGS